MLNYMGLQSVRYDLATEQQHTQESSQLTALKRQALPLLPLQSIGDHSFNFPHYYSVISTKQRIFQSLLPKRCFRAELSLSHASSLSHHNKGLVHKESRSHSGIGKCDKWLGFLKAFNPFVNHVNITECRNGCITTKLYMGILCCMAKSLLSPAILLQEVHILLPLAAPN